MYRKILFLGILIALVISGCSSSTEQASVSKTGIKILQDTPEQAYVTYFELFNSKDRLEAYDLISPQNRKNASKKDFQEWAKTLPYKKEKIIYTVSSQSGSLAVAGVVKLIDVNETTAGVYSIFALVKDGDKWYLEMDVEGLAKNRKKEISTLALDVHKKVQRALASNEINLDNKFKEQIKGQVTAFETTIQSDSNSQSEGKPKTESKSQSETNSPKKK